MTLLDFVPILRNGHCDHTGGCPGDEVFVCRKCCDEIADLIERLTSLMIQHRALGDAIDKMREAQPR